MFCGRSAAAARLTGSPAPACVGCGWCCLDNPCEESHRKYGYLPRCPELVWDAAAGRYWCALMQHRFAGQATKDALFAGEGCCARHNPWRTAVRWRG
ncbi:hypothetical protein [Megalodesulfovibrio gigas]|uniref:hypothetical protein n=1 Tax=Megalodesulfovibrio gigas TaxID=879 RepID=UPI001F18E80F|nr:hypothetical protein [Megalodesulfovibrio gigas]